MAQVDPHGPARVRRPVTVGFAAAGVLWLVVLVWLFTLVPQKDGARAWFQNVNPGGWMAWTFPTAVFFLVIAGLLILFTWLAIRFPETPRRGVLGIVTTRGDRLFISLLSSAFVCLGWLALVGPPMWGGLAVALIYAAAVFRWV